MSMFYRDDGSMDWGQGNSPQQKGLYGGAAMGLDQYFSKMDQIKNSLGKRQAGDIATALHGGSNFSEAPQMPSMLGEVGQGAMAGYAQGQNVQNAQVQRNLARSLAQKFGGEKYGGTPESDSPTSSPSLTPEEAAQPVTPRPAPQYSLTQKMPTGPYGNAQLLTPEERMAYGLATQNNQQPSWGSLFPGAQY